MKNSITLTALFLLLFSGVFASVPNNDNVAADAKNSVSVYGLFNKIGVKVRLPENTGSAAIVTITDKLNEVLYKGKIGSGKGISKTYDLSELPNGDYKITIYQNRQETNKQVHIYDNNGQKDYFIMQ